MKQGEGFKPNSTFRGADLPFIGLEWSRGKTGSRPVFWGSGIPHKTGTKTYSFTHTTSPSETIFPGRGPDPKISLIREKTALMFWDIPGSKPVWLSGEFSELKITANSTYWEAKRW